MHLSPNAVEPEDLLDDGSGGNPPDARPVILVPGQHSDGNGGHWEIGNHEFAEKVFAALPPTTLFRMDTVVGELLGKPGRKRFRPVSEHRLRGIVDAHVKLGKWVKPRNEGSILKYLASSRDHAAVLLANAEVSDFIPQLKLLTPYPVFHPGMKLVRGGWNADCGIYYDEPVDLQGLEPEENPSLDCVLDLVVDFPFDGDASRANAIGFAFTIVLRPCIVGNVPFHLVTAPLERTGKGKLVENVAGCLVLGGSVPTIQTGKSEEEREKRITSLILRGASVVHFDNLPTEEVFDSAAFASLATTQSWMGRKLGESNAPCLPNTLIPVMSGNNTRESAEVLKRTVPIRLQPTTDRPEERTDFQHPDIEAYVRSRRRLVLAHLLGFVEKWIAAGQPAEHGIRMGGFEEWVRVAGGVTTFAGARAWMTNYSEWVRKGDEFAADAAVLMTHWLAVYGEHEVRTEQILDLVKNTGVYPHVVARKPEGQLVCLAKSVLTRLETRPVDVYVVKSRGAGSSKRYRIERLR